HTAMALQLMHEKKAFSCFCSDEWLDKKRDESKEKQEAYRYDDACANLPAELVIDNMNPFSIRINKPTEEIIIKDHIKGEVTVKPEELESFVIMRQDKTPTYDFACAVDDMLNDISIVIHSEEYMSNTPKQEHIRSSLKYDKKIEYAHLPNLLNADTLSVKWLLEEGFLPEAISNYLISTGNKPPKEIFTLSEALEWFSLENISKSPAGFDIDILRHINSEHLKMLDAKELSRYVGFADEEIGHLARVYLEEVSTTKELKSKIKAIFDSKEIPQEFTEPSALIVKTIKSAPYFEDYNDFKNYTLKESGLKEEDLSKALPYILTGTGDGPDIAEIYKYIKNYIGEIVK
ncbi:MAG: glutamate--tRNA ligase, partial [Sulfurimonas sp.]|nr:glutamate--tRNA ligase [Sulfurimonas sp.]